MNKAFPFLHWLLTLVIAPFISQGLISLFGSNPHQMATLLEYYPITLLISFYLSLPAFVAYFICFLLLEYFMISGINAKFILIGVTVAGILTTTKLTGGTLMDDVNWAYSVTALITGLLLPIRSNIIPPDESGLPVQKPDTASP